MNYLSIEQARKAKGLRIVSTVGAPNPWCLAARYVFEHKDLPYQLVAHEMGSDNPALAEWSGQSSAPVVAYNDERLLTSYESIILLAERLSSHNALLPKDPTLRVQLFGLLRELCGEQSFAWNRRLMILHMSNDLESTEYYQQLCIKYGYTTEQAEQAESKACEVITLFKQQLHHQQTVGSRFLIGDSLTALDIYAAVFFSIMIKPLPHERIPMPPMLRHCWEAPTPALEKLVDETLLGYRQFIVEQHLNLPMRF